MAVWSTGENRLATAAPSPPTDGPVSFETFENDMIFFEQGVVLPFPIAANTPLPPCKPHRRHRSGHVEDSKLEPELGVGLAPGSHGLCGHGQPVKTHIADCHFLNDYPASLVSPGIP